MEEDILHFSTLLLSVPSLIYLYDLFEVTMITTDSIQNGFMWGHNTILDPFPSLLFAFLTAEHEGDIFEARV